MQIDIQARDFTLTEGLRAHVERRLRFALTRYRDCVRRITVRLADVNGPGVARTSVACCSFG
ncbi:MAG: hypothetical protein DI596_01835 [Azospira oryzae]|nr:MAG: hypothetical protein DI596_01835 [Azospira oryzae]PZP82442.1 MAG: hypothetical protein DI593_01835 [Azospira oryzae]